MQFHLQRPLTLMIAAMLCACAGSSMSAKNEAVITVTEQAPEQDLMYELLVGEIANQRGEYDIAVKSLERVARATRNGRLAQQAVQIAVFSRDYALALPVARLWEELNPDSHEAIESLAILLLFNEKTDEAEIRLKKILAIYAQDDHLEEGFAQIVNALARIRQQGMAMQTMDNLVKEYEKSPVAYYAQSELALRINRMPEALTAINRALSLRPAWERAALLKAHLLTISADPETASAYYRNTVSKYPKHIQLHLDYARYLVEQKEWVQARDQFIVIAKKSPNYKDAVYSAGLLSLQLSEFKKAIFYLKKALVIDPEDDQIRLYLGKASQKLKRYGQALNWYKKIRNPIHRFDAQVHMAFVLVETNGIKKARAHLKTIPAQNIAQRVRLTLAEERILTQAKQFNQALELLNKALDNLPENKELLYARALAAEKLDMLEVAERDLRKIIVSHPEDAHALNALGYTLIDRTDRYNEAKELIERALTLRPQDPFILDSMGWLQYRMNNRPAAVKYLRQAFTLQKDAEISAHLGEVLWEMGLHSEAEEVWRQGLQVNPINEKLRETVKRFKPILLCCPR